MADETAVATAATNDANRRTRGEATLDRLVSENRFTIAVVFPVVGAISLLASAEGLLPPPLAFNPLLVIVGVLVMRLPLAAGLGPLLDRRAGVALLALTAYAYAIEAIGIATGWPYGAFAYLVDLGPMVAGVPLGLPVFFLPLVVNSYLLVRLLLGHRAGHRILRLPATILAVLAMDVVLDPGAVALGFWTYFDPGAFYGVPLSNYLGWVLSATVAVVVLDWGFRESALDRRLDSCEYLLDDLVSFVLLWGAINAVYGQWLPVLVALGFGVGLLATDRFDFAVFRRQATGQRTPQESPSLDTKN